MNETPTYLRVSDMVARPACELCAANDGAIREAEFIAAQSVDKGDSITWLCICRGHAQGWNDGGDWSAPVFRIAARRVEAV